MSNLSNASLGFLLVIGSGLATSLGAAVVFWKRLIVLANHSVLGGALGLAAGVMLYVSFIEIFYKSKDAFESAGLPERDSYLYATLCFFGGVICVKLLNRLVHWLDASHMSHADLDEDMVRQILLEDENEKNDNKPYRHPTSESIEMKASIAHVNDDRQSIPDTIIHAAGHSCLDDESDEEHAIDPVEEQIEFADRVAHTREKVDRRLQRMGLMTALAIALHNFPEGLATFVATLADPSLGISLCVAVAIHNIPEGLCVSVPIYFATKNRTKAFLWGFLSGVTEIIGAGLGWAVLSEVIDDLVYGILFGLVSGMMVAICVYELLPTAHRYDPHDKLVSNFAFAGMAIMAISLIAFQY
jgi:zinc transporter, ZIP family